MDKASSLFENIPIKWRLFLLETVLAVSILGSISLFCLWKLQGAIETDQRDDLQAVASQIASATDNNLHNAGQQLRHLAESNTIKEFYLDGTRHPLEEEFLKREILFPEISLIDPSGKEEVKVSGGKPSTNYKNYSGLALLRFANMNRGHEVLGKPYFSIKLNGAFVDIACQGCGDDHHPDFTLRASLSLDLLESAVSDINVARGSFFVLFNENGYILASSRKGYPLLRLSAAPVNDNIGARQLLDGKQYFGHYRFLNCDCVIAESSPTTRNLRAVVAIPFKTYQVPIYRLRENILLIFLVAVLVSMLGIAWVIKRFMAPITLLTNAARGAVQNGSTDHNLEWRADDEIADLARGFNMMQSRLTQAEEAYVNEKNRFDKILLCLADMLFIVDAKGTINHTNKTSQDTLRYKDRDIEGLPIWRLFKEGRTLILSIIGELRRTTVLHNIETTMLAADGSKLPVILSATFINDVDTPTQQSLILICKRIEGKNDSEHSPQHYHDEMTTNGNLLENQTSQPTEDDEMDTGGKRPAA